MTGPRYDERSGAPIPPDPEAGYDRPAAAAGSGPAPQYERDASAGPPSERDQSAAGSAVPEKVPARTRVSGIWVALTAAVVVLLLLLIFILQNGDHVQINIFGANPRLPLGVALLLAAVLGALLVALVGAARVVQLRHTARRMARKSR